MFREMLPAEIHTDGLVFIHGYWLFSGNCAGGVAVFELSKDTVSEIERERIQFFERASEPQKEGRYKIAYNPWHTTPLPENWTSVDSPNGACAGLKCAVGNAEIKKVIDAAWNNVGYYAVANRGGARLVVLPKLRRFVASYSAL